MNLTQIKQAVKFLHDKGINDFENAIILGTGLGKLASLVTNKTVIPYSEIPHFPLSTVESHSGNFIAGNLGESRIIIFQGRFHFYEGYSMDEIVFPVRVIKFLGVKNLFIEFAKPNCVDTVSLIVEKGDILFPCKL